MEHFRKIKSKILFLVITVSMSGLLLTGAGSLLSMARMQKQIREQNGLLGSKAAEDSRASLEKKVEDQLKTLSEGMARTTDEKLHMIENQTMMAADMAGYIYSHPDLYTGKRTDVDYLKEEEAGRFTLHIKTARGVTKKKIQKELNLISNLSGLLCEVNRLDLGIKASYIGSASGFQLSADKNPQGPGNRDFPVTERPWYKGAVAAGGIHWTDVFVDVSTKQPCIDCAMPYYDTSGAEPALKGVAVSAATLEQIRELIRSSKVGETGKSFLVDRKGNVMISAGEMKIVDGEVVYDNLFFDESRSVRAAAKNMADGKKGLERVVWDEKEVLLAYYPLSVMPWTMATIVDADEISAPSRELADEIYRLADGTVIKLSGDINRSAALFLFLLFAFGAAAVILSLRLAKRITGPVRVLTQNVKAVSGGYLDAPVEEISSGDEIQILSEAFIKMKTELKAYIKNIADITAEKERIGAELHVATQIQASMLPCIFPAFPERKEFDIYASMCPAKEVGGDFYDFFLVDGSHLAVVMADVSGKGVPAALFMVIAKTLIKNQAQAGLQPGEIFTAVNSQLCENNEAGMFVTAWMGILETDTGRLACANAGHNPPLIKRSTGAFEYRREQPGFVLAGIDGICYRQEEFCLEEGDELFLYTDGVTEATNTENELYGEERLKRVMDRNAEAGPEQLLREVTEDMQAFVGKAPQFDDFTMLVLKINNRRKLL